MSGKESGKMGRSGFDAEVEKVVLDVVASGDMEGVLRDAVRSSIEDGIRRAFEYGPCRDAIRGKINEVMVPYIEQSDFGRYTATVDSILQELIEESAVAEHRRVLDNFKAVMSYPAGREVSLRELFDAYCGCVAREVCTGDLEVVADDAAPRYSCVRAECAVERRSHGLSSCYETAEAVLRTAQDDGLTYVLRLSRWGGDEPWRVLYEPEGGMPALADMSSFEAYLTALSRGRGRISGPLEDMEEDVSPLAEPSCSWE